VLRSKKLLIERLRAAAPWPMLVDA